MTRIAVLLICTVLACGMTGCVTIQLPAASPSPSVENPESPTEPPTVAATEKSQEPEAEPNPNIGRPIVDLHDKAAAGEDSDRAELLEVAHGATGIADPFYVWQLYVQGTSALGDLQGSQSGMRYLVAFEHDGTAWTALYQVPYLEADRGQVIKRAPIVSSELAAAVELLVPVKDAKHLSGVDADALGDGWGRPTQLVTPSRLPEGFELESHVIDRFQVSSVFSDGARRIRFYTWMLADLGGRPQPTFTNLRFGQAAAMMDPDFPNPAGSGSGPFLWTDAVDQVVIGEGVSPGVVAGVAQSAVPFDSAGNLIAR